MKKEFLFLVVFFVFSIINFNFISASCQSNQIDINSASLEKLDELYGIGPVKAQAIIDSRPFEKVDDLIDVVGIGEATLSNIKQQGLACVSDEKEQENEKEVQEEVEDEEDEKDIQDEEDEEEEEKETKLVSYKFVPEQENQKIQEQEKKLDAIVLNKITPKSIKSEDNTEQLSNNKLANYGIVLLCVLLVFLFVLKKKENEKSEFK